MYKTVENFRKENKNTEKISFHIQCMKQATILVFIISIFSCAVTQQLILYFLYSLLEWAAPLMYGPILADFL